jgi:hypothetical protein
LILVLNRAENIRHPHPQNRKNQPLILWCSPQMKRSTHVTAPLLAAAALSLLTGCNKQMQRCVDEHNNVVDDNFCKNQPNAQQQQRPDGHGGFIFVPLPYRYYYGGYGGFGIGSQAGGGSYTPAPGARYTTRGGFGSSFAEGGSHSSGSSGGSSHGASGAGE